MKIRYLLTSVVLIAVAGSGLFFASLNENVPNYHPRTPKNGSEINGIKGAIEWLDRLRVNPATGRVDLADVDAALKQVSELKNQSKNLNEDPTWIEMGPDNVGGRTRSILIDKNNPNTVFAGSVSGGIWKSVNEGLSWYQVPCTADENSVGVNSSDIVSSLIVSSICQTSNGDIYFGTGESFAGGSGFYGLGIWKSTNGGTSFARLSSTWSDANSKATFVFVNKIAADPGSNKVYAATMKGLRVSTDGGATWENPIPTEIRAAEDVKVGKGGTVVVSIKGSVYISSNGATDSFTKNTIAAGASRQEFAISPEDDNYIYCLIANNAGAMLGVFKSIDKGLTWTQIGTPGTYSFNILGNQGVYDNVIAVFPNDKNKIICGGQLNLWVYDIGWKPVSAWSVSPNNPAYVHADHHAFTFHPTNPNILYIGTDGGVFKSADGANTFVAMNRKYNVTQFYAMGMSGDGKVIAGSQDNGTQYCDFSGNTVKNFVEVKGGDGGYCEISTLKPDVSFGTTYFGALVRSETPGSFMSGNYFFNDSMLLAYWAGTEANITRENVGGLQPSSFVTPITLWESYNDSLSTDSVFFKADRNYNAGDIIHAKSKMDLRDLPCTLSKPLLKDSTVLVQDKFQSMLAIGMNKQVWVTRKALDFSIAQSTWYPINSKSLGLGLLTSLIFSKDGNYLFCTNGYSLVRSSNLNYSRSEKQMNANKATCTIQTDIIGQFNGTISSIAVDPNNANNVIVTLGGFNNSGGKVYYSTNATAEASLVTFTAKDNFMFPVYSSLVAIDYSSSGGNSKRYFIGTEYGIYSTNDISVTNPVWKSENSIGNVPVFMLRQQTIPNTWETGVKNQGIIYAATYGRGIWRLETFKGPVSIDENKFAQNVINNVSVYPNPAHGSTHVALELSKVSDVTINIYDIQGKLVKTLTLQNQVAGKHSYPINISNLGKGTFVINTISEGNKVVSKLMVY